MTFLPIVGRELRVSARRKSTYRLRTWMVVIALVVGFCSLFPALAVGTSGSLGKSLYTVLTTFIFALCLLAGVLLTADCLSEEKRAGTLGLLFLTDLRGYDVVLGKLMAMSLNAFYGLLAILPVTGLCLLLGGLTGGEFWRTNLTLLNALFVSLAAGLCVSAFGRDSQRVMGGTLFLIILLAAGVPLLVGLGRTLGMPPGVQCCAWISPYTPFAGALEPVYLRQPEKYWLSLAASQLGGWLLLALASGALPHRWQERVAGETSRSLRRAARGDGRATAARARARKELLQANPVLWLMSSGPDLRRVAWIIVAAWGLVVVLTMAFAPLQMGAFGLSVYGVRPFGFLLKCLVVVQACHFFVEARRSGALETLLCTPLTSGDIIRSQALALRNSFLWPVLTLLLVLLVPTLIPLALSVPTLAKWFGAQTWVPTGASTTPFGLLSAGVYCLRMFTDCYAIGAYGIWLALTAKKPAMAPARTILFVLILPSLLCWLDIFVDLCFILWGVTKLQRMDLRSLLAQT